MNELGGKFEVEEGRGGERDEKLKEYKIQTYLIIPPKQQVRKKSDFYCVFQGFR